MTRRSIRWALLSLAVVLALGSLLQGCAGGTSSSGDAAKTSEQTSGASGAGEASPTPPAKEATPTAEGEKLYTPTYTPNGDERAVIKTSKGTIVVQLFGKDAPIHVGNFVELARKGFYDGTRFHRYEPGFVVQGGDPNSKGLTAEQVKKAAASGGSYDPAKPPLGTGGPGYTIKGEFDPAMNPNKHIQGALGMARSQSPDSAGSQFYFTLADTPFLDGNYTVFGRVTDGLDVMMKLGVGDEIESVSIENASE